MWKSAVKRFLVLPLLLALLGLPAPGHAYPGVNFDDFDGNRAMLLSYILREYLTDHHFSNKELDDSLSAAAFDLYLKQLDVQKKFLLAADVERLRAYSDRIDDEMMKGKVELPRVAARIMKQRVAAVQAKLPQLLAVDFDFDRDEYLEIDPEKTAFCRNEQELWERWRKMIKMQIERRYLDLLEEAGLKPEQPLTALPAAKQDELRAQAIEKVRKNHEDYLARLLEESDADRYDQYFEAITRAFDPHTIYLPPVTKEDFDIHMRGSLEGIGARLREEDGFVKVESIIPGSAAYRQGQLEAEDLILKVGEGAGEPVDITDMRLRDAVGLIRGEKGTEVRLTVRKPDGAALVIPIVRDVVVIEETFVKYDSFQDPRDGERYGYIKIPSFYRDFDAPENGTCRNVTDDTRQALREIGTRRINGLILDLRNNSGGSLSDAVTTAGLFIRTGPIVQVKESQGKIQTLADNEASIEYSGPVVVLVNRFSASASEIVAGALQDYGRAIVIGDEHTHGKGTVQAVIDLDRGLRLDKMDEFKPLGALKVTTQKFYRISGDSTQYRGVIPDIILPDWFSGMETGEQYLDYSLPWDTVAPVKYAKWAEVPPELAALRARSSERVAASAEFAEIRKRAEQAEAKRKETMQPLMLEKLRAERLEAESARKLLSRMHIRTDQEEPAAGDEGKKEAEKEDWLTQVKEDPYVKEAAAVLQDLSAARKGMVAGKTPELTTASP